ncbi:hypothetical protein CI109_101138 [Kwoniella shandongensis]|uniref:Uncharacterized protein n=1 Tax=Kwoniella shandongensis TaxID=1734106 RepID=A0A5M6C5Y9_9TREE|nr:uncharacterized protein CI109_001608 [Kwoniella shandongensis]KAA5530201.1 hypothetical protein CI109_001608 [Kwoniella shandongensis]
MTGVTEPRAQSLERHAYPTASNTTTRAMDTDASASSGTGEVEAGPSRSRRHSQVGSGDCERTEASVSAADAICDEDGNDDDDVDDERRRRHKSTSSPLPHLDIATYPTQQLLRLLANLLQQIATSNDQLRPESDTEEDSDQPSGDRTGGGGSDAGEGGGGGIRSRPHSRTSGVSSNAASSSSPTTELFHQHHHTAESSEQRQRPGSATHSRSNSELISPPSLADYPLFSASKASLSHPSSLLAFHARHVPSISIEAYLLRILKYCPTTNEVFLGLLVYFDRMTRLGTPLGVGGEGAGLGVGLGKGKGFAIDSYNVHRLVIAGVTVASKFFSDVFYTNSRYAKVGGLPPTELNSLELQFLLLNDFRLRISIEEMQKYGDRLLAYAEEEERELVDSMEGYRREKDGRSQHGEEHAKSTPSTAGPNVHVQDTHFASAEQSKEGEETSMQVDGENESESQPAVAPDHPSAPNSAPPSRNDSAPASASASIPISTKQPHHSQTYPPPTAATSVHPIAVNTGAMPRSKQEKDSWVGNGNGNGNGGVGESHAHAVPSGLRDWPRADEVIGGRMTTPMRD